ncbi:hypothetical protein B0H13DRAFT_974262 [Mycena leptocephala]|nr:hypothetical protein B0H13DRAFT_974262 [Mycena leptocephala]
MLSFVVDLVSCGREGDAGNAWDPLGVDHTTGTRDASRYFWVCVLEIERLTHNLGLERHVHAEWATHRPSPVILPTYSRVLDSFMPGLPVCLSTLSPGFISMPVLFLEQRKACRTGRWWPEPQAFPLDFDCSPAEERPNPGAVSVGFRAPWVTLSLSAAIHACRCLGGEAQKRRRAHRDPHGFTSMGGRRRGVWFCDLNLQGHEQESIGTRPLDICWLLRDG